jgi:hypothetical protein
MLRQVLAYLFLLIGLVYVCIGNQDANVFYQSQDLRNSL